MVSAVRRPTSRKTRDVGHPHAWFAVILQGSAEGLPRNSLGAPPSPSAARHDAGKVDSTASAPKGASDSEGVAVSLRRYPDTKPEYFSAVRPVGEMRELSQR